MNSNGIIGQTYMAQRLTQLADAGRLPHALMLCGASGTGKLALAIHLAEHILNKGSYQVKECMHPDLHYTYPTIKLKKWNSEYKPISNDFIKEWQQILETGPYFTLSAWMEKMQAENQQAIITVGEANELIKKLNTKANQGGWKINIIWLPERMNLDCANKMLKIIEEPPAQTLFIMVCQEPEKLLETIRSRVQRYDVPPIDMQDIAAALVSKRMLSKDDAERIARLASGSWLTAIEELEVDSEKKLFLDYFIALMRTAYLRNIKDMKRWSEAVAANGREQQKRFLTYCLRMTREAFVYNFHTPTLNYMTKEEEGFCVKFARFVNEGNVIGFQEVFQLAQRDISQNANSKIVLFDVTLKVAVLLHTTQKIPRT